MAAPAAMLLIRPWILEVQSILHALRTVELEPIFTRVDIEPALCAALKRQVFVAALYDPAVIEIPHSLAQNRIAELAPRLPLIVIQGAQLGERVKRAIAI